MIVIGQIPELLLHNTWHYYHDYCACIIWSISHFHHRGHNKLNQMYVASYCLQFLRFIWQADWWESAREYIKSCSSFVLYLVAIKRSFCFCIIWPLGFLFFIRFSYLLIWLLHAWQPWHRHNFTGYL